MEKTEKKEEKKNLGDTAAKKIAGFIIRIQTRWAAWMHKRDQRLTPRARKLILLTFIVLMAGSSAYSIVEVFDGKSESIGSAVVQEVPLPLLQQTESSPDTSDAKLLEKLIAFEKHMDSLSRSEGGMKERQQILRAHPGLMDSVRRVREMYTERLK